MSAADNLITNSSIELDANSDNWPDNWTKITEAGKTATYAWSGTAKFGNKSISITNPTGWAVASSDYIPATVNDKFIVSGYVKTSNITGSSLIKVDFYNSSDVWTDASGNTVAQYSYDAWGKILSQSGSMAAINPFRYAGYRYDEATGLYYLMARYYDPGMGRFISRDTFHGFENEPQSLHQYAYCANNPVMYIDPSGHYFWEKVPTSTVAILILYSGYKAISGYYVAKDFLKKNKNKIVYQIKGKILSMFGNVVAHGLFTVVDLALTLWGTSAGDLLAKALDYADPWWGNKKYIRSNGYVFGYNSENNG